MHPFLSLTDSIVIPTYSLLVTLAIIIGVVTAYLECRRYGIPLELFPAGAFWTVLGGIIGGKVFNILFFQWEAFVLHPIETLTRSGGWMYYGAEIGGAIGLLAYLFVNRIPVLRPIDICGVVLLLAHAVGRMGCYFAGCCYGIQTDSWAGVMFPGRDYPVHPTQLYESIPLAAAFVIFWIYRKRFVMPGSVYAAYLMVYGLMRFIIEFFRGDGYTFGIMDMSPSQYIALAAFCTGAWLLSYVAKRHAQEPA